MFEFSPTCLPPQRHNNQLSIFPEGHSSRNIAEAKWLHEENNEPRQRQGSFRGHTDDSCCECWIIHIWKLEISWANFAGNESRKLWFRFRSFINLLLQQVQRAAVSIMACQVWSPEKQRGLRGAAIPLSGRLRPLPNQADDFFYVWR